MKEQKKIIIWSLVIGIISIVIATILEFKIDKLIYLLACGHRNFAINILIGVFSGALLSFLTSVIICKHQKNKILHQDIINLMEICDTYKRLFDRINIDSSNEKENKLFRLELIDALYKSIQNREIYIENEFVITKMICLKKEGQYLAHAKLLCNNLMPLVKEFRNNYLLYCNNKISADDISDISKEFIKSITIYNKDIDDCLEWAKKIESEI